MKRFLIAALAAGGLMATPALAKDGVQTRTTDTAFADVAQAAQDAIINSGYAVDYHGFIGEMLKRTAADVGATKELYKDAEFFTFCSAVVSRDVMEGDIEDIAFCPYVVFVYEAVETPGTVTVGFRELPAGGKRDQVNDILTGIIESAADGF